MGEYIKVNAQIILFTTCITLLSGKILKAFFAFIPIPLLLGWVKVHLIYDKRKNNSIEINKSRVKYIMFSLRIIS